MQGRQGAELMLASLGMLRTGPALSASPAGKLSSLQPGSKGRDLYPPPQGLLGFSSLAGSPLSRCFRKSS